MLLGRVTYEIFAAYWPTADPEGAEFKDIDEQLPKYVASSTLKEPLEWENSHLLQGDMAEAVRSSRKRTAATCKVVGSSKLAQSLAEAGLVDEWRSDHPIVMGTGKRLFPAEGGPRIPMKLKDNKVSPTGVLILTYTPE